MNCSKCRNGVMEKIASMELKEGPLSITMDLEEATEKGKINMKICSRCGHVEFVADPGVLSLVKRQIRASLYSK